MAELNFTMLDRTGTPRALSAAPGDVLMQVLRDQVDLTLGTCGGAMSCGTCLVRLSAGWLSRIAPPSQDEADMLEALDAGPDCRLSCQLTLDATVAGERGELVCAD